MKKEFWLERWEREEIGFHENEVNTYLTQFWQESHFAPGSTVFVPMCGKSVDMHWLAEQGHQVVGVELSEIAAKTFFSEHGYSENYVRNGNFGQYSANGIHILCGDYFDLSREDLSAVSAIYDRASMVALPPELRRKYVSHLVKILPAESKILLVTFDYPQAEMQGPPFAVSSEEIETLYSEHADIKLLTQVDILAENPRFQKRGLTRLQESVYLLTLR